MSCGAACCLVDDAPWTFWRPGWFFSDPLEEQEEPEGRRIEAKCWCVYVQRCWKLWCERAAGTEDLRVRKQDFLFCFVLRAWGLLKCQVVDILVPVHLHENKFAVGFCLLLPIYLLWSLFQSDYFFSSSSQMFCWRCSECSVNEPKEQISWLMETGKAPPKSGNIGRQ